MNSQVVLSYEEYKEVIEKFAPTMHDYLFILDFIHDRFYITEQALLRFSLPSNEFTDVA